MKEMLRSVPALLAVVLLVTGCAGIAARKPQDALRLAEASKLVASLESDNRGLERFKGTGRFRMRQAGRGFSARVAWIGCYPNKLRIAVLNPAGQPAASLASDGRYLYLLSHSEAKFYKEAATHPTLQKLVAIPISVADIIAMLTGRLPVRPHDQADLTPEESYPGTVLALKRGWRGVVEKIYLDMPKRTATRIDMFGLSGNLLYRADFSGQKQVDGYRLPERIVVSGAEGDRFELAIGNYSTDVSLSPSTFVLTPP